MSDPLISACLIVKNEEANLARCLTAISTLGDVLGEVCVYDTGSSDRTVEIAESHGARVERGYWDDDFSRARNAAAAMAVHEWVLVVDADEMVACRPEALRSVLDEAMRPKARSVQAVRVPVVGLVGGREVDEFTSIRIYRPAEVGYVGAVHEQVRQPGGGTPELIEVGRKTIHIAHGGYDPRHADLEAKWRRNAELASHAIHAAEARGETDSYDLVRALVDRSRALSDLGELEEAAVCLERATRMKASPQYRSFGLERLIEIRLNQGRVPEAEGTLGELERLGVARPDYLRWLAARIALHHGDADGALEHLRSIDELVDSAGLTHDPAIVLDARLRAALLCKEYLEAAACILALMGGHGVFGDGHVNLLLKLTHQLSDEQLADFVVEQGPRHRREMLRRLDADTGRGPAVAQAVRHRTRTGASFFGAR